jgi:hypothetical protein
MIRCVTTDQVVREISTYAARELRTSLSTEAE